MCGLWMRQLADADPQQFVDPRTDDRSFAHEKLQLWTNADCVLSFSMARILFFFDIYAKRQKL